MTPNTVMIFAAGFGTRLSPLTETKPKPMIELGGRPMIDLALDNARALDIKNVIVNAHYKADCLEAHLDQSCVTVIKEHPHLLDTGGGLKNALPLLGPNPVWTYNPDALWIGPNPLRVVAEHWQPERMDALLLCIKPDDALGVTSSGDFQPHPDGRLERGPGLIYGGIQIIKPGLVADIDTEIFSLNLVWDALQSNQRLFGCRYPGTWCDLGNHDGLSRAQQILEDA